MFLLDDSGDIVNAEFSLDLLDDEHCIVIESAGGRPRRNPDYNRLQRIILERLAHAGVRLTKVVLDSRPVAKLPISDRVADVGVKYPVDLRKVEIETFRKKLQGAIASIHRQPGVGKNAGNPQRRIRLCLSRPVAPERLLVAQHDKHSLDNVPDVPPGEKKTVAKRLYDARVGQGRFRNALLKRYEGACPVLGARNSVLLIASHIKPWAVSNNAERLDSNNGILLSAMLDRLFDKGLISFTDAGELLTSPRVSEADRDICGLGKAKPISIPIESRKYLEYHRKVEFKRTA